jgi:hypothetical protein
MHSGSMARAASALPMSAVSQRGTRRSFDRPQCADSHIVSGFVVDTFDQAVAAVKRIASLDRRKVRAAFEQHFTAERMARDYVAIYQAITAPMAEQHLRSIRAHDQAMITQSEKPMRIHIPNRSERVERRDHDEISDSGQPRKSRGGKKVPNLPLGGSEGTPSDYPRGAS